MKNLVIFFLFIVSLHGADNTYSSIAERNAFELTSEKPIAILPPVREILVPNIFIKNTISCDIRPAFISYTDHLAVSFKFYTNEKEDRGPGLWKINNSILENVEYQTMVQNIIDKAKIFAASRELDNRHTWEYCKQIIKNDTIKFCKTIN